MSQRDLAESDAVELGYEPRDVSARPLLISALIVVVAVGLVVAGATVLQASISQRPVTIQPLDLTRAQPTPSAPEPRLEVQPGGGRASVDAQQAVLESYGWVDRANGKVRIPIERAMQLVVEGQSP